MYRVVLYVDVYRLKIVTDAVWSSPSSAGKKDLEVSIETFESKSGMPVCSHIGVTVTGVENFSEGDVTEKALLLYVPGYIWELGWDLYIVMC